MAAPIQVLVVDDSPTTRQMLAEMIISTPDMTVVGVARDGKQAVEMNARLKPQVILMDIVMPNMDGLEATREIMYQRPAPIVLVSASLESYETDIAFQAIKAGALTVLQKPGSVTGSDYTEQVAALLNTVRSMAGVQVIRHWPKRDKNGFDVAKSLPAAAQPELIGIVSSTGGPAALGEILQCLPPDFRLPIVIVQHIAADFVGSLVEWLQSTTKLPVILARQGDSPAPGIIYLAPGDAHLRLSAQRTFALDPNRQARMHMPSGDILFESIAESYGARAAGVILTGMGSDGAQGLRTLYNAGSLTIAQDESTCVVFGMPREAILQGAARLVLPLPRIGEVLVHMSHTLALPK